MAYVREVGRGEWMRWQGHCHVLVVGIMHPSLLSSGFISKSVCVAMMRTPPLGHGCISKFVLVGIVLSYPL